MGYDNLEMWMVDPDKVYIDNKGSVMINSDGHHRRFYYEASPWCNSSYRPSFTGNTAQEDVIAPNPVSSLLPGLMTM